MRLIITLILLFFLLFLVLPTYSQDLSYQYLLDLGKSHFRQHRYNEALHYFKLAQMVKSSSKEALHYINLIKRIMEGRVISEEQIQELEKSVKSQKRKEKIKKVEELSKDIEHKKQRDQLISDTLDKFKKAPETKRELSSLPSTKQPLKRTFEKVSPTKEKKVKQVKKEGRIDLTEADIKDFPITINVPIDNYIIISSDVIKRSLITSPETVTAEKINASTLKLYMEKMGSTFVHIWDQKDRWTLNIKVAHPKVYTEQQKQWEEAEGFKFMYHVDWDSYAKGNQFGTMKKDSVDMTHWAGVTGPTPYGDFYGFVEGEKLDTKTDITGYGLSLTDGKFWNFEDFSLYGFDFTKDFSPLSFPGMTLRGAALESPAFNDKIDYTVLYGREKETYYYYISPGVGYTEDKDAFIEGYRLRLFPYDNHTISLNYARGYGSDRQDYLKDKAFSVETEHNFDKLSLNTEIASDEDKVAATMATRYHSKKLNLALSLHDIEKDFVTITGRPPNRGEIGGMLDISWRPTKKFSWDSNFDVYRERYLPNPDEPNKVNLEWSNNLNLNLTERSYLLNNTYYIYRPGVISPHRSINTNTTYNKRFQIGFLDNRYLSTYLGYGYQKSKYSISPISNYRKNDISSGIRVELLPDLYSYCDYTYSWVKELQSKEKSTPRVYSAGLDYYHDFSPSLSSNFRVHYRDEQETTALHSFLAGEDSLEGNANFTYTPNRNTEFFLDSRIRNVWAEAPDAEAYIEAELSLGARLAWDSFFSWNPKTKIEGYVFEDKNSDGIKDKGESGIENVTIIIGPNETVSDKNGSFATSVRAKNVTINIDLSTVPDKYVLTTPASEKMDISKGGIKTVNFGLSSQSGIYGVIFYDVNNNNKLDQEDLPIPQARLILDKDKETLTNNEGIYYFDNILPGKHTVKLGVNSLPLQYLPKLSIKKEITVEQGHTYTYHIPLGKK